MEEGWLKELVGDKYKSMSALGRELAKHPSVADVGIGERALGNRLAKLNRVVELQWWKGKGAMYTAPLAELLGLSLDYLERRIAAATQPSEGGYDFEHFEQLKPFDCLNESLPPGYPSVFYESSWTGLYLWTAPEDFDVQEDLIWTYAEAHGWYCRQCEQVPEAIDSIRQPILLEVKRQHIRDNLEWVTFIKNALNRKIVICLSGDVRVDIKSVIAEPETQSQSLWDWNNRTGKEKQPSARWVSSPPVDQWFGQLCDWVEQRHLGDWSANDYKEALGSYARYFKADLNHILSVLAQFDATRDWEDNIRRWFTIHVEQVFEPEEQDKLSWFQAHGFEHLVEFKRQQMLECQAEPMINEADQIQLMQNVSSMEEANEIMQQWSGGISALRLMAPALLADRAFDVALTTFVVDEMSIAEQARVLFWPQYADDVLLCWSARLYENPIDLQDFLRALEQTDEMTQMLGINALFRLIGSMLLSDVFVAKTLLKALWDKQMTSDWLYDEDRKPFVHVCSRRLLIGDDAWWHTALLLISYELKDTISPSFYCPWEADDQTRALWKNISLCRGWPVWVFDILGGWLWKHDIKMRFYDDAGWQHYEVVMFWLTGQAQEDDVASWLPQWSPDLARLEAAAKRHSLELDDVLKRLWPHWLSRKQLKYRYPFVDSVSTEDRQRVVSLLDPDMLTDEDCKKLFDTILEYSTVGWSEALWMRVSQSKDFDLSHVERRGVPTSVLQDIWLRDDWNHHHYWGASKLFAEQLSAQQLDTWIEQYQNQYPWRVLRLVQYAEFSVCLQWYERWLPVWSDDRDTFDKHLKSIKSSLFYIFNHQNRDQSAAKAFELYRSYFTG